jgi:hypothetical protein
LAREVGVPPPDPAADRGKESARDEAAPPPDPAADRLPRRPRTESWKQDPVLAPYDLIERLRRPLAQAYLWRAVHEMTASSAEAGAELALAYLPQLWDSRVDHDMVRLLERVAAAEGLRLVDLTAATADAYGVPRAQTRLPKDGHLSAHGAEVVAAQLAAELGLGPAQAP